MTAARELSQVMAAAAAPFLRLGEHGGEKRKGMEEAGWRFCGAS
jgi:hypothetical protein